MKNRVLLETRVRLAMPEETDKALEANKKLIEPLYDAKNPGCAPSGTFYIVFFLVNIGMYFLLKNVSPGYIFPKMLLGNVIIFVLILLIMFIIVNILLRRKRKKQEEEFQNEFNDNVVEEFSADVFNEFDNIPIDGKKYLIGNLNNLTKPKLTLREHDFTYGVKTHEWKNVRGYTNTDEWIFVMLGDESLLPIKIDNLKEKRRMEIIGIFADRIRRAKLPNDKKISP